MVVCRRTVTIVLTYVATMFVLLLIKKHLFAKTYKREVSFCFQSFQK